MTAEDPPLLAPNLEPAHTRCLDIAFSQGEEGTIVFRADILDLRKAGLMELAGRIATAGIIHNMSLMGTFEIETGEIKSLDWDQSHVMHEANRATKGECCRDPMTRLKGLIGTQLGESFRADLKQCFGGPLGCTHVNTLFQELSATVARFQALRRADPSLAGEREVGDRAVRRAVFFDAFFPEDAPTSALRIRLTDSHYSPTIGSQGEEMYSHHEIRLLAQVSLMGWQIQTLEGLERIRRGPLMSDAPWRNRSAELSDFAGRSLGGGMGRYCNDHFGSDPEDACLLSALLCVAPGMTQVGPAIADSLDPSPVARPQGSGSPLAGAGPCFMLRSEGPLMQTITGNTGETQGE